MPPTKLNYSARTQISFTVSLYRSGTFSHNCTFVLNGVLFLERKNQQQQPTTNRIFRQSGRYKCECECECKCYRSLSSQYEQWQLKRDKSRVMILHALEHCIVNRIENHSLIRHLKMLLHICHRWCEKKSADSIERRLFFFQLSLSWLLA